MSSNNSTAADRGEGRSHSRGTGGTFRQRISSFKGTTPEMNGNVFECYDEQTDCRQYMKTIEALKYAEDLAPLFAAKMKIPTLEKPTRLGEEADKTDIAIWNEDVRDYAKRKRVLCGNLAAIHAVPK
jgi:hypothetical protein